MNKYFALVYPTGELVGIDPQSGGYPYKTDIFGMEKFRTVRKALDYMSHFKEFKLVKVKINVEVVDIHTEVELLVKLTESLSQEQGVA